jgi:LacI family transcriptional regulator
MKKESTHRPTIIDVARVVGVSKSTVARALSGATNINVETREKVKAAAQSIGYERNHLAQSLRSGRTGMLGLLIPDIANPFWAEVARGAQDSAVSQGASLLVFNSDWNAKTEANHLRAMRRARVDGAIVNPVANNIDELERFGAPVVVIGSGAEHFPELSSVGSDISQGIRLGLDEIFAKGHLAPALLVGTQDRLAGIRFREEVFSYFKAQNLNPEHLMIEEGEYTVSSGKAAAQRLLARQARRPLCIFAANDLMALGALLAVREAGLKCPEDVSIFGFDGIPAGVFSDPGLSTVAKPAREIGETAVEVLLKNVAGDMSRERLKLSCRLKARGSLADISGKAPVKLTALG